MRLPPSILLVILVLSNLLNYIDRGIIPGASNELNGFTQEAFGPGASASTVSAWFGALISAYIASYSVAAVVFGQLARAEKRPLRLVGSGLLVWCVAALMCCFAQPPAGKKASMFNFGLLLAGRTLSGVGEAGFQCIVPGLIMATAPANRKAIWMAALFTPIPVGTAMGYMIGAIAATSFGWGSAYGAEVILMLPIAIVFCFTETDAPADSRDLSLSTEGSVLLDTGSAEKESYADSSLWVGVREILSSIDFCFITLGYAAHTAVFAGLAAFGPTLVLGLGFFHGDESRASTSFGAAVALGGAIGTPLGGWLSDRIAAKSSTLMNMCEAEQAAFSEAKRLEERKLSLKSMISMIAIAAFIAMFCAMAPSEKIFLPLLMVVVMFAYGASATITMATLSCVGSDLQPLAMSLNTLGIHAFGDVPSPILIGLLKGSLAPNCMATPPHLHLSPKCAENRVGLRITLAITVAYLFTAVLWWVAAFRRCEQQKWKTGSIPMETLDDNYASIDPA